MNFKGLWKKWRSLCNEHPIYADVLTGVGAVLLIVGVIIVLGS